MPNFFFTNLFTKFFKGLGWVEEESKTKFIFLFGWKANI